MLKELIALHEAAELKVVVADLWIGYIGEDSAEQEVTVKVITKFDTADKAKAFAEKISDSELDNEDFQFDLARDAGCNDIETIHGPSYFINVKIVSKAPATSKKVFVMPANIEGIKKV